MTRPPTPPQPIGPELTHSARRQVTRRVASALMVAGAAGLGTYAFYDAKQPVRRRIDPDRLVADHRVHVSLQTPLMVIARAKIQ